jgi:exo-1,4-beta-D-glucosaminidase
LPQARIEASATKEGKGIAVHLRNPSNTLAFQVSVSAVGPDGENIVPTLWSDNYIELMPGESATVSTSIPPHVPQNYSVVVSSWNAPTINLHPAGEHTVAAIAPRNE